MPLFEFKCDECGQVVEVLANNVHAADKETPVCTCNHNPMARQVSSATVKPHYGDMRYWGTPQYRDYRSKECGIGDS